MTSLLLFIWLQISFKVLFYFIVILVQQNQPRNVILCLMEVARIASRFNIDPPGLIALEKEIAEEESRDLNDWHFQPIRARPSLSRSVRFILVKFYEPNLVQRVRNQRCSS